MHGQLGEGRFKAYSLGPQISWLTKKSLSAPTQIIGDKNRLGEFQVEVEVPKKKIGTQFKAVNLEGESISLPEDEKVQEFLTRRFASLLLGDAELP